MTDIHCHILPHMDDGPAHLEDSLALIRAQMRDGVTRAVATPHFDPESRSVERFVRARGESAARVADALSRAGLVFPIVPGAEVLLHPSLPGLEQAPLCFGGGSLMLVELPDPGRWPLWADDVLYELRLKGTTPILAHVERYGYVLGHPEKLASLSAMGVLLQVNAGSLLAPSLRGFLRKLFGHRLISFVASDCHSVDRRPPRLAPALALAEKQLGPEQPALWRADADAAFKGRIPAPPDILPFKKTLWERFFSGKNK